MKKILSCILTGAMLISSMGAISIFADGSKTENTQSQTLVVTENVYNKNQEASAKTQSQQPASKTSWPLQAARVAHVAIDAVCLILASCICIAKLSNFALGTSLTIVSDKVDDFGLFTGLMILTNRLRSCSK
ncbi:MAG: hypothetical protein RUMPE_00238 [Eubacteriales bacterium SKADARSKE-1]|nr:hypothetical protein [Eubacteriales bacterium SKADARSKE-1]